MEEVTIEVAPPSSSDVPIEEASETSESEPKPKKRKVSEGERDANEKLEHRLGGILRCAVCLDLPRSAVYQCVNGHLMCAACFTHLLADARLRDDASASCPNCRVEISKTTVTRNLAVEKAVSELPSECRFCTKVFPRHSLQHHEESVCDDRGTEYKFSQIVVCSESTTSFASTSLVQRRYLDVLVRILSGLFYLVATAARRSHVAATAVSALRHLARNPSLRRESGCRYTSIGCPWRGPRHARATHEAECATPRRSAADVAEAVARRDADRAASLALFDQVLDLLSSENITFHDLELKPYRTEEFVHKLYYESLRFTAFGQQWVVKAYVNRNQREPAHSAQREITYQVVARSKVCGVVAVRWAALRGPHGAARLTAAVCAHQFRAEDAASPPAPLPLRDPQDANRLLANRAIYFRLIMFQA